MTTITGITTHRVNLRAGAGTTFPILTVLVPRTPFTVLQQQGEWLKVSANGREGFLHRGFVQLTPVTAATAAAPPAPAQPTPASAAPAPPSPPAAPAPRASLGATLGDIPLAPPADKLLRVDPKAPLLNRLAARIWNQYGNLLEALSAQLQIEPAVAVAVFAVESGGQTFSPVTNKMLIRFENHVFYNLWGRHNQAVFERHFTFNPNQRWLGHKWRPTPNEDWRPPDRPDFHGDQVREWEVLDFARTLDDEAAKKSISMGAPQIMGFNHAVIGYATVHELFDAFNHPDRAQAERAQVVGFFDFVNANPQRIAALQAQDFVAFARSYNGIGQEQLYGTNIKATFDAFNAMRAAAGF
ncbi:MAG: N-acetylmuramidase domain-containing protein [Anaerolineales bacterium]|nr:N-acetylmuramidase domain-containing protein [Anaerolineales bacterium]